MARVPGFNLYGGPTQGPQTQEEADKSEAYEKIMAETLPYVRMGDWNDSDGEVPDES